MLVFEQQAFSILIRCESDSNVSNCIIESGNHQKPRISTKWGILIDISEGSESAFIEVRPVVSRPEVPNHQSLHLQNTIRKASAGKEESWLKRPVMDWNILSQLAIVVSPVHSPKCQSWPSDSIENLDRALNANVQKPSPMKARQLKPNQLNAPLEKSWET
jgi:hypothetical protein